MGVPDVLGAGRSRGLPRRAKSDRSASGFKKSFLVSCQEMLSGGLDSPKKKKRGAGLGESTPPPPALSREALRLSDKNL